MTIWSRLKRMTGGTAHAEDATRKAEDPARSRVARCAPPASSSETPTRQAPPSEEACPPSEGVAHSAPAPAPASSENVGSAETPKTAASASTEAVDRSDAASSALGREGDVDAQDAQDAHDAQDGGRDADAEEVRKPTCGVETSASAPSTAGPAGTAFPAASGVVRGAASAEGSAEAPAAVETLAQRAQRDPREWDAVAASPEVPQASSSGGASAKASQAEAYDDALLRAKEARAASEQAALLANAEAAAAAAEKHAKEAPTARKDLERLKRHLQQENPVLVQTLEQLEVLDAASRRLGLMGEEESYARAIAWWPLIAVLGPYSAGKSSFLNHYLDYGLQETGTQALDDRFTVICYASDGTSRTLPGSALDADPRFPFYQMSRELEKVAPGEGVRVDTYLQLKTCPSDTLRGMILIDSPGFDADAQRTATLRITDYIIDLSDLVLVLFDARRPEPGAMRDTLEHLVRRTVNRKDAAKFLYILNQIDLTAREDNPEEVVGAWQRALAQAGLTAGRFYRTYNPDCAAPIADPVLRERFERKRDHDLAAIHDRMAHVRVERAYRIVGALKKIAVEMRDRELPRVEALYHDYRKSLFYRDGFYLGGLALATAGLLAWSAVASAGWGSLLWSGWAAPLVLLVLVAGAGAWLHRLAGRHALRAAKERLRKEEGDARRQRKLLGALARNASPWRTAFARQPVALTPALEKELDAVVERGETLIQTLNDLYANPTGDPRHRQ